MAYPGSVVPALVLALVLGTTIAGNAEALMLGDAEKGRTVHDEKCAGCHLKQFSGDAALVYTRPNRRVKSVEGLLGQVEFCNRQTGANLNDDQINDVAKYLNDTFYKFDQD